MEPQVLVDMSAWVEFVNGRESPERHAVTDLVRGDAEACTFGVVEALSGGQMRMHFLIPFLVAIVPTGCGRSDAQLREPVPSRPRVEAPEQLRAEASPVLGASPSRMASSMRDAYRLRPDQRFLAALDELDTLLLGKSSGETVATISEGGWSLTKGGELVGDVSSYPSFDQLFEVCVRRAHAMGAVPGADQSVPESGRFVIPAALAELRAAEKRWLSGARGEASLLGARALGRLNFQTLDDLELADVLAARGLALLAIARAASAGAGKREEAMLAASMGYLAHAEGLASSLPPKDALRAFLEDDVKGLAALAAQSGSEEAGVLRVHHVARGEDPSATENEAQRAEASDLYRVSMETGAHGEMAREIAANVLAKRWNEVRGGISAIATAGR